MFGQLVPCGGGDPLPLLKPSLVVGRTPDCDLTLPFGTVSSRHCVLERRDGAWHVRDLGSRNGIRIDGVRTSEGRLLPGSVLWIAQNRYQVDYVLDAAGERGRPAAVPLAATRPASLPDSGTTMIEPPLAPPS